MNYDQPRQMKNGRWDYTRRNDNRIYPLGYCWDHFHSSNQGGHHATEAEAIECYTNYCLDNSLRFSIMEQRQEKCMVEECANLTSWKLMICGWPAFSSEGFFCSSHQNKESVRRYWKAAQQSIHS